MKDHENPMSFEEEFIVGGKRITYENVMELCQGCPSVGNLIINDELVSPKYRFGGPLIRQGNYIHVPVLIKRFRSSGFKLARINLETLEFRLFGKIVSLIFLDRIEDGTIHFFEDLDRVKKNSYEVDN